MTTSESTAEELPGRVQFRGSTTSSDTVAKPDTEIVVTDEIVAAHPMAGARPDSPVEFEISLDELLRIECEGFLCRRILLETATETYEVPTLELDELNFRRAIVKNSSLTNTCMRLNLDRFGVCPCRAGVYTGSLMSVVGVALALSVVGVGLGAGFLAIGFSLLGLTYVARKLGQYRGANVWERKPTETEAAG